MKGKQVALISTGGTIEKTYDEMAGVLANKVRVLDIMLESVVLHGCDITRVPLMNKDSTEMSDADHTLIAKTAEAFTQSHDGVVIVHGTDRLTLTGERCCEILGQPRVPVVLMGAMRPYEMRHTDATQNLTEALLAVQLVEPGIFVAMHNRVLQFPGVKKDLSLGTFIKST